MTDKAMMAGNIQGHRFYGWVLERIQHHPAHRINNLMPWTYQDMISAKIAEAKDAA
ncbi:MAG: hypothetical protein P8O08_01430 [Paracoccaceae bacterium]|jgi:hypothetical protein|nr:hypothetical protein [Marinovum sp.]MDA9159248.1 transposase domain-containing protein [Paracoccaceae bacterium]MDB3977610.1 transposase domain-containing protein [bacterium]MDG1256064.1 hypothetical protein [Paracoccaceae bacterium]|tara:strand:- start:336 stop:503 length:168 start_codon:yes stop_codon:yes gene_type:complete